MTISEVFDNLYKAELALKQVGLMFDVTVNLSTIEGGYHCNCIKSFENVKEMMVHSYKENAEAYIQKLEAMNFNVFPESRGYDGRQMRYSLFDVNLSDRGERIQAWIDIRG